MSKNLQTPTKLTEFAPLQQEEKPQSVGQFISKFFKISKPEEIPVPENVSAAQDTVPNWAKDASDSSDTSIPNMYSVDVNEGRSLPNILKRISNLLDLRTNNLQDYADTELKQYWMPDSVSKECYECSEKFTTFRRRHHCRVCGQIFCSQCCNQQIPGKIFGCTGDLRVCTYCCKIVLSYLQSSNFGAALSADLKVLQENLQSKFSDLPTTSFSTDLPQNANLKTSESSEPLRRKVSVGYQEEKFASGSSVTYLTNEEKCKALQNSVSLRNLYEEICKPVTGINFTPYKYRLRTFQDCFLGSELVDWLICQQKAKTRVQAAALCQALLEGGYLESFSEPSAFVDGYVRYKKGNLFCSNSMQLSPSFEVPVQEEPSWVQQIPHESSNTDSENEQMSPSLAGLSTSSSYMLNLNVEASTVYLSRPPDSPYDVQGVENENTHQCEQEETAVVRPSEQRELAPESGWFNAPSLREENGEKEAYELLTETYEQHEQTILKQLLSAKSLSHSWENILIPLVQDVVSVVRPDKNHDAIELDIRNYVQFKKLQGDDKKETCLINGIVCSKNVAHKNMSTDVDNPKILLLQCLIVYQRNEGRLMSLEPVLMQEHEYLRHVAARIVSLQPDIVLVHKNVSRLAQDMLRQNNISLIHNVKLTVLERLSRCTQADIVTAVDAHIGRPKLGTCKRFYVKRFNTERGFQKTLMFFEGLPCPWLGATVLLRSPSKYELVKVKAVISFLLFASYNWRLEKSFLMDEFALPPNSKIEFLEDSREHSPEFPKPKLSINEQIDAEMQRNSTVEEKKDQSHERKTATQKIVSESISDCTDPLQASFDSNKNQFQANTNETLSVAELPFSNNFKKHLDDTILCISPYIIFPIPYLETDSGKKSKLRRFFYKDLYYSEQFEGNIRNKKRNLDMEKILEAENNKRNIQPLHPFQTVQITNIENNDIQNLLAHFRACGGQYQKKETLNIVDADDVTCVVKEKKDESKKDVLDPTNHQRLAVLFCSFSHESSNAPAFCVNPWVVYMDFYGRNDIPIGCFLERYCFRPTYACPSKTCVTPMVRHIRRFVHNSGCVTITLNNFESEFAEENIVMWSWCTQCQSVSPVVPMSADTWSYSFGKYLELRFHGDIFNRRGHNPCKHSLHHDHFQYFGFKNYVASFKFSSINIWEISLPPSLVELHYDREDLHQTLIDDTRKYAQKGHEIFAIVQEKLSSLFTEELEGFGNLQMLIGKEQSQFKQKVEDVQLKLTSPTVENKDFDMKHLYQSYWKIQDSVTKLKISLVELAECWNSHLTEAIRQDKKKEKTNTTDLESPVIDNVDSKLSLSVPREPGDHEKECLTDDSAQRRCSDVSVVTHIDDSTDSKKDQAKKTEKSVKTILDKLLPSSGTLNLIQAPFTPQEHYLLPVGQYGPVVVYENEIGSIIAYALNSIDYKKSLEELTVKKTHGSDQTPSPIPKRKYTSGDKDKNDPDDKGSGLLGFLRVKDSKTELPSSLGTSGGVSEVQDSEVWIASEKPDDAKKTKNSHVEVQFQDGTCNFFCRIYLADKFAGLRAAVLPIGEEAYIRSLSRSVQWKARGGKSGSNFSKTLDDRFVLKDMSKTEVQLFLESASNYFVYMQKCSTTAQPTLLGKILGIYQIIYKNSSNVTHRSNVLVMENLFYNKEVSQKFDLKGSMRNRLVIPDNQEGEIVLLDENLVKMTCDSPLYVLPHSKEVLLAAIQNDTEFLSTQSVMDYSLLVGLDTQNKELVLGIIDYIRTFTWDKRLETMVKRSGILGGQGKLPTIVSPEEYQKRFIEAMHKYFLEVPDHYAGLCKGLEV